jgi:tetratricopeptide (TPR) repeat protein
MKRKVFSLIFGLLITISFFEITTRLSSWAFERSKLESLSNVAQSNSLPKKEITIATLGESTTALSGNENDTFLTQESSYPALLEKYLNDKKLPFHFRVINRGIMMGVTSQIVEEFEKTIDSEKPDLVIAMMGIKDVFDPHSKYYSGLAQSSYQSLSWFSNHSSLYRFILNIQQQVAQKSTHLKKPKNVESFSDISKTFIESNFRFMAVDVGVMSALNPHYSLKQVKEISERIYLGIYYFRTWQNSRAKNVFEKLISEDHFGYFTYANLLLERGEIDEAEKIYKHFIEIYPLSPYGYRELVKIYASKNKTRELSELTKLVEKLKLTTTLPVALGFSQKYKNEKSWGQIIKSLSPHCAPTVGYSFKSYLNNETILFTQKYNSNDLMRECLNLLTTAYISTQKYRLAEATINKFTRNSQMAFSGHYLLSKLYSLTNRNEEAEKNLNQIMIKNSRAGEYFALADYYKNNNEEQKYENVFKSLVTNFKDTTNNFKTLNNIVSGYGGKLIVMQYPTFKLEPMRELSGNLPNVAYISNEKIFDIGPREEFFFEPNHPYNFSHYTNRGSHLLAQHVANEIEHIIKEGKLWK